MCFIEILHTFSTEQYLQKGLEFCLFRLHLAETRVSTIVFLLIPDFLLI